MLPLFVSAPIIAAEGARDAGTAGFNPPTEQSIVHGAHIPPIWQNNTEITAYNNLIGKDAGIVMSFYPWNIKFEGHMCGFFDNTYRHRNDGGTPGVNDCMQDYAPQTPEVSTTYMITWEPHRNPTGDVACNVAPGNKTDLNAIINGSCDAYIDSFARDLKNWHDRFGDRFMIRPMHEMNIVHSAWFKDDANYPQRFRQAFQRIVTRFRAQGATAEMAQFVWSPNWQSFPARSWNTIPNYYPGDEYVDWIGLSGYNWFGANGQDPAWRTFDGLFVDPIPELGMGVLPYLHCNYAKPIMLAEFGTVEGPGGSRTKAAWVSDAYERMLDFPYVRAAVYFNDFAFSNPGHADFRVTHGSSDMDRGTTWPPAPGWQQSLGAPTNAYKNAVNGDRFLDAVPALSTLTPSTTYCGAFPPVYVPPSLNAPDSIIIEEGHSLSFQIQAQNIESAYTLSIGNVSGGLNVQVNPSQVSPANPYATVTVTAPNGSNNGSFTISGQGVGDVEPIGDSVTVRVYDQLRHIYAPLIRE